MSEEKNFKTTAALGSFISALGWFVVVVSIIAGIVIKGAGIPVVIGGGALGILMVVQGQLLQIIVAIEHNTRKSAKDQA